MKLRVAAIAFLLAVVSTGATWLSLQPTLVTLLEWLKREAPTASAPMVTRLKLVLPFTLALVLVALTLVTFLVIHYTVGRPIQKTQSAIEQLSPLDLSFEFTSGGPLLSRLQKSLTRMTEDLQLEQRLTQEKVDELKRANEKLVRAQADLLVSDRLATVGKLAAGVAHEVGNPLSGILGYLSVIESRTQDNPEVREMLVAIEAEVRRIDQIVHSLLDLGRPSKGKPTPIDVNAVVHAAVKLLSKSQEMLRIQVEEALQPGLVAMAEPGPLSQIVINLLLNASHAMNGSGKVWVRSRMEDARALIEIEDQGPGLNSEVQAHLFEPFFTTKPAGKGTGLGLVVSQHLAQAMGGRLHGTNATSGSARFTLELPAP